MLRALVLLKFERIEPLAKWLAERLAQTYRRNRELLEVDMVVPVSLRRDREKDRGYNQAELLSKPLAKILKLPLEGVLPVAKAAATGKTCVNAFVNAGRRCVALLKYGQAARLTIGVSYC